MILWGCSLPGSFSLLNDNSFQRNLDLWDFSVNFSCLLQKSDRCALSWTILLLKAAGLTVSDSGKCVTLFLFLWTFQSYLKHSIKIFFFSWALFCWELFCSYALHQQVGFSCASAFQPAAPSALSNKDGLTRACLQLWLVELSHTWILSCLNNTLKDLPETMSTSMSNCGGSGGTDDDDTLAYTSVCQRFSLWLDATPGLGQLVLSSGESCIRDSLAVLLQTLALLRVAQRFQWPGHFIWPGCFPVFPCDHH